MSSIVSSLIWAPQALQDIQRLYQFLAIKNINAAKRAVNIIRENFNILAKQPEVGRPVADMAVKFREWLVNFGDSGYVVLYHYDCNKQHAVILSIKHQKEIAYSR